MTILSTANRFFSRPPLTFLLGIGIIACPLFVQAQASCGECWAGVTQWHGTWNLTLTGSGLNDSSSGSFDISNGTQTVTGNGSVSGSFSGFCSMSGSGALDPSSSVQILIDTTNCTYSLILNDRLTYTDTTLGGSMSSIEDCSGNAVTPAGLIPEGALPYFPLPEYGEPLVESSGTFSTPLAGVGCYGFGAATLTISWNIEPVVETGPPEFTQLPASGPLGCNPTSIPDVNDVLDDTDADAPSGQVSITALKADVTNDCSITRSFTLTATDDCTGEQATALIVYSWTEDTTPPVVAGVPAGGSLGCNPTNKPTDGSVMGALTVIDSCGMVTTNVTHVDVTNSCTVTRTFTITAADECGNVSPTNTVVFSWTTDTTAPSVTGVPPGGVLGCNPANPPTDASVGAQVQGNDNCGIGSKNISHSDSVNGCTLTRTFTITVTDNCGNVSPPSTVVYTWTVDTTAPTFTQLPPGGYLGTNPPCVPDDGSIAALSQASDNCGVASLTVTHVDSGDTNLFTRAFTITATDFCGNPGVATVTYTWSGTASATPSEPVLNISNLGSNMFLSWPTDANCFYLITSSNLRSGLWTLVTNSPGVQSNRFVVTNGVRNGSGFYRLTK